MTGLEKHPIFERSGAGAGRGMTLRMPVPGAPRNRMLNESEVAPRRRIRRRPKAGKRRANAVVPVPEDTTHADVVAPAPDGKVMTLEQNDPAQSVPLGRTPPVRDPSMDSPVLPPSHSLVAKKPRGPSAVRAARRALRLDDPLGLDDETLAAPVRDATGLPRSVVDGALLPVTLPIKTRDAILRLVDAGIRGGAAGIAEVAYNLGLDQGMAKRLERDILALIEVGRHRSRR